MFHETATIIYKLRIQEALNLQIHTLVVLFFFSIVHAVANPQTTLDLIEHSTSIDPKSLINQVDFNWLFNVCHLLSCDFLHRSHIYTVYDMRSV